MAENIKLYDREYTEVLLETGDRAVATQYLMKSGKDWLPMTIDRGDWRTKWSGRLEMRQDGTVKTCRDIEFMKYLVTWPEM